MNLNQITECAFCGEKCHSIVGPAIDPTRVEFDCGSVVEKYYGEKNPVWPVRCRFADSKHEPKTPLVASRSCCRCGSPVKIRLKDQEDTVVAVEYFCGSTLRVPAGQPWEFDGLCRNTPKITAPKPVLHIVRETDCPTSADIKRYEESGYVVVLTRTEVGVRVLSPEPALASVEDIGMAALESMQGPTNDSVRAKFAEILFRKLQARDGGAK